ncbi:hypothetical protein [Bacillus clarus]|nr:hypothetical protein [Bacillus clarus]
MKLEKLNSTEAYFLLHQNKVINLTGAAQRVYFTRFYKTSTPSTVTSPEIFYVLSGSSTDVFQIPYANITKQCVSSGDTMGYYFYSGYADLPASNATYNKAQMAVGCSKGVKTIWYCLSNEVSSVNM